MSHDPTNRIASSFSRRSLLQGSAAMAATSALAKPSRAAAGTAARPVLIQVFLRGGMDGLTTVVPYGDDALYSLRPRLAITSRPSTWTGSSASRRRPLRSSRPTTTAGS